MITLVELTDLAAAYKDMSPETLKEHGIPPQLTRMLARIADRKLLPEVGYRLLLRGGPDTTADNMATWPLEQQAKALEEGVAVWRGDGPKVVAIEEIKAPEVRVLRDPVSGRFLTPEEQAARMAPRPCGRTSRSP